MKTKSKLTAADVTPGLKSAVNAYLMARARHEVIREKIDAAYNAILFNEPYYESEEWVERKAARRGMAVEEAHRRRILNHTDAYLMNEADCAKFIDLCDDAARALGFEVPERGHCPALAAENLQRQTEWLVIELGAEMLGVENPKDFNSTLLCGTKELNGLECRQKFIDLAVGLAVNLPGFRNPLAGKGAA